MRRLWRSTESQSPASNTAASRPRGRLLALVAALAFVAGACSGGGGGESAGLDEEYRPTPGERDVQIPGAAKLKMGATLAVPVNAKGTSPAVLIIPGPGATNRDGPIVARPADPLYKDLSGTLTGAGMVTLRYDHRGIGDSQLEAGQQLSWDDMVEDAREALKFLSQRQEVDPKRMAVVGHDMGGVIAMKLAATDDRIKGVALISTPGRPLVDVWADSYRFTHGPVSSDAYRAMIDGLLTNGTLPARDVMRPEFQSSLPPNQDAFFKAMFSVDPANEAKGVKQPVFMVTGERSTAVKTLDVDRLSQNLAGRKEAVVAPNSSSSLQQILAPPVRPFDPLDMDSHGLGPPVAEAPREQGTVDKIVAFVGGTVGARAA
ncbi:MAG TPA: alpha/beta fold hydrolase [Acidimicrobiales bacterium]|nr:alpha/beta fold hydrolase [Acidimicrobiales bacterium]